MTNLSCEKGELCSAKVCIFGEFKNAGVFDISSRIDIAQNVAWGDFCVSVEKISQSEA